MFPPYVDNLFFMPLLYRYEKIELGAPTRSGHVVYRKALYEKKRVIFKLNKHNNSDFSRYELAFSGLAQRFLQPHLTSQLALVANEQEEIVGLAAQHFFYEAAAREGFKQKFYTIKKENNGLHVAAKKVKAAEDIPVYFFDQFDPGFFKKLSQSEKKEEISFDIESIASVLTTSFTLEEDDLHKGNLGFYLVEKAGKPHVVFFKIDHDMMMSDSVMSYFSPRLFNLRHADHSFEITARDLRHFPKLFDSNNHYWPTTKRYLTKPSDNKIYNDLDEIDAFVQLGKREDFQKAKWRNFYKHILLPITLIQQSLSLSFDKALSNDRAQIAMITNTVVARQALLRAVLFSMPEFRAFIKQMRNDEHRALLKEIFYDVDDKTRKSLEPDLIKTINEQAQLCHQDVFIKGDTPMHVAIRMGDYRYNETWKSFSQFAEKKNSEGKKPLDIALEMRTQPSKKNDIRGDSLFIAKHLLKKGAHETSSYRLLSIADKRSIRNYRFSSVMMEKAARITTFPQLVDLMQDIGEDHRFSLKMKKSLTVHCIRRFITAQHRNPKLLSILKEYKLALNGDKNRNAQPEWQFIRQLRSRLWIVRKIRGLLGGTATQVALNKVIDAEITRLKPKSDCGCFPLFSSKPSAKKQSSTNDEKKENDFSPKFSA
jgi:hypothetical protein